MDLTLKDRRLIIELGVILFIKIVILFCLKIIFFSADNAASLPHPNNHFFQRSDIDNQENKSKYQPNNPASGQFNRVEKEL